MITKHLIPHIAQRLLEEHGLSQQGWTFQLDNARRRAGCCKYRNKTITLSRHYVDLNVAERSDDVIDTILHEIAHALAGPTENHGPVWKAICVQIGAKPERCYDSEVIDMPTGRWAATCGGCSKVFHRHKRVRGWRYCSACGPKKGRLQFIDTAQAINTQDTPPAPRRLR